VPYIRQVVAIHEAYRLSAADRGAQLEDLDHREGWDAVIADRVTIDDTLEARRALRRLAELPERQRQDLSLRVAGFSYHEIAKLS
jgi:DNA-directed RNA polymerase specialized sigma24 family protein